MRNLIKHIIILQVLLICKVFSIDLPLEDRIYSNSIPLKNEKELKVNIEVAMTKLVIGRDHLDNVISYEINRKGKYPDPELRYRIMDNIGYLNISTKDESTIKFRGINSDRWILNFTDKIPISFDIEIGAGKGTLDLTDLKIKDLNISAGAGSVYLTFNKLNSHVIESINLESGVSKFKAYNLSNANFNYLKFSGGLGSYELDFSGELNREVDADIELGLGSLTITIPKYIGTKVYYEKNWFSSFDIDKDFDEEGNEFTTPNYYNTKGKINIRINAGLGSIKIKLIK